MPGPTDFPQIVRIVKYAMQNAMLLEEGQDPNSEQLAVGINRLNDLCNFLQTQGLRLWTVQDQVIPLIAGTSLYQLLGTGDGKQLRIPKDMCYTLNLTSFVKTPVLTMSWQEWTLLSQNGQQGPISQIFVDKQQNQLNVNTYLIPDTTEASSKALHVVIQTQLRQGQMLTDNISFPQEWYIGLQWMLAAELCTGQPQEVIMRCEQKSAFYKKELDSWDVEDDETFFTPDTRRGYSYGSFR